jgi:Peptidase A4 family
VSPRRGVAALLALALIGGGAGVASAQAASTTSANWAGYAVREAGTAFRHVGGTWTVPAVDCTEGSGESYSANWVGLGGYSSSSKALEQLGTESDCSRNGTATYSAWFEVVPAAATTAKLTVKPGDVIRASAAVRGTLVTLKMTNLTRGRTATKTVRASAVDVTSAEWIVEAPSLCDTACTQSPLANFGSTGFSAASATTGAGHTGTILDAAWTPVAITLRASARDGAGPGGFLPGAGGGGAAPGRGRGVDPPSSGGATPGALTATSDGFGVTYGDGTTATTP